MPGALSIRIPAVVVALLMLTGPAFSQDREAGFDRAVLDAINAARANPQAYADRLMSYRAFFRGPMVVEPGHTPAMTHEGTAAVDDAIAYLRERKPAPPLAYSPALAAAAHRLAADLGPSGRVSHVGADGATLRTRIQDAGLYAAAMEEDISLTETTPQDVARQLIIDDGVAGRGHRVAIFDPGLTRAGVASGPHKVYQTLAVIDFAGDILRDEAPGGPTTTDGPKPADTPKTPEPKAPEPKTPPKDPGDVEKPPVIYGHDPALKGCQVVIAKLVYAGAADAAPEFPKKPLELPTDYSAPKPGVAGSHNLGPSVGPIPAQPGMTFAGNAFEYHSDVIDPKTGPSCTSQQFRKFMILTIDPATKLIGDHDKAGEGVSAKATWKPDVLAPLAGPADFRMSGTFAGSSHIGALTARDSAGFTFTFYQGTPTVVHWIDTPGLVAEAPPAKGPPPAAGVKVLVALLRSVTYDGGRAPSGARESGWECISRHIVAIDLATGQPMAAAQARTLFNGVTAKKGAPAVRTEAQALLSDPPAKGGFQGTTNPEFQDLGCKHFDRKT